jgi:hypothetical protein
MVMNLKKARVVCPQIPRSLWNLWIFCLGVLHAKNPDSRGCCGPRSDGSLSGIKIHDRDFLYDFALKCNKLPEYPEKRSGNENTLYIRSD